MDDAPPSAQAAASLPSSTSAPSQSQPSTSASTEPVTGSCLCAAVRFTITPPLPRIQVCHCAQCRKAQGGPIATNIPIASSSLSLSGQDSIKEYESTAGKFRAFCGMCGSPVYSRRADLPGVYRIRAGLLDEPLPVEVEVGLHQWVADKASWWGRPEGEEVYERAKPEARSRG